MEKFSYGLEFYKNNIYKLEDTNLFKRKVKEAEKILDELREKVDNSKYHFGIKTYKDFTGEVNEDVLHNDFVVYAKPLE